MLTPMPAHLSRSLKRNPFYTYRHGQTGQWITVIPPALAEQLRCPEAYARKPELVGAEEFERLNSPPSGLEHPLQAPP